MTYGSQPPLSSSSRRSLLGCWWIEWRLQRRLSWPLALVRWASTLWPSWPDDSHHPTAPGQPESAYPLSSIWSTHLSAKSTRFDLFLNCFLKCPSLIFKSHCKKSKDQKFKGQTRIEIADVTLRRCLDRIIVISYFQAGHKLKGLSLRFTVKPYTCSEAFADQCMIAFENKWKLLFF